jgi:ABC-type multidrug transport system ATPase subunit
MIPATGSSKSNGFTYDAGGAKEVTEISRRHGRTGFFLHPISCELRAGQITGVVGMNASGKTTFLRILLGELRKDSGEIRYFGMAGRKTNWLEIKGAIGYVPQLPGRWPGRLLHNLNHTAAAYGKTGRKNVEIIDDYVHRYGLYDYRDATWDEISGGFKIRFELVRALLSEPKLLILDEPLAYLDIVTQQIFLHDLVTIADSLENPIPIPIVVTSQHLYEIEAIADRMIILDDGHCLFSGPVAEIPTSEDYHIFEVSASIDKSNLLEDLRAVGLTDLEKTATGWILIFKKQKTRAEVSQAIVDKLNDSLVYFRDISRSTRLLFRNRRDDFTLRTKFN